jgi:hypothetical protein
MHVAEQSGEALDHGAQVREQARTTRTVARWNAARRIAPYCFGALAAVGVAFALGGETTEVAADVAAEINVLLSVGISIAIPSCLVKILWDRRQKRRLRDRIVDLENDNRTLQREVGMVSGQLTELREQLADQSRQLTDLRRQVADQR